MERQLVSVHQYLKDQARAISSRTLLRVEERPNVSFIDPCGLAGPTVQKEEVGVTGPPLSAATQLPLSAIRLEIDNIPDSEVKVTPLSTVMKVESDHTPDTEVKVARLSSSAATALPRECLDAEADRIQHDQRETSEKENMPQIVVRNIQGARLSKAELELKNKLMQDIKRADAVISQWQNFQADVKRQLKKLETKEVQLEKEALVEQLQAERQARRRVEEKMRRLEGERTQKSVLDSVDTCEYQELVFGDGFKF